MARAGGPGDRCGSLSTLRRKALLTVLAISGVLSVLTGCQSTLDHIKANYAVKQGNDLYKAEGYLKAIDWYRYATYLNPDLDIAYKNTAFAYMGEYKPGSKHPKDIRYSQGAIDNLKQYLKHYGDDQDAENYLLTVYLESERFDEAAAYFEDRLRQKGSDTDAASSLMQRIGMIYAKKGDFEQSLEWYKKRAEIRKDDPEALYTIGVLCWDKVYHAPLTIDLDRRKELIELGLQYLKRAMDLRDPYSAAALYVNLLYREKAKVGQQTGNMDEYAHWMQEADKMQKVGIEMRKAEMAQK